MTTAAERPPCLIILAEQPPCLPSPPPPAGRPPAAGPSSLPLQAEVSALPASLGTQCRLPPPLPIMLSQRADHQSITPVGRRGGRRASAARPPACRAPCPPAGGQTFMIDPWEPPAQGQNFGEHDAKVGWARSLWPVGRWLGVAGRSHACVRLHVGAAAPCSAAGRCPSEWAPPGHAPSGGSGDSEVGSSACCCTAGRMLRCRQADRRRVAFPLNNSLLPMCWPTACATFEILSSPLACGTVRPAAEPLSQKPPEPTLAPCPPSSPTSSTLACRPPPPPWQVGDSVTFKWTGTHGVYSIPDGNCPDVRGGALYMTGVVVVMGGGGGGPSPGR